MNQIPIEMVTLLLEWYQTNKRILPWRENKDPYRIWVSEIMLQQTRVEAVIPYYERFLKELPTLSDLANAPEEQLLKLWEGLGYYNRVRNLKKGACMVMEEYNGKIPSDYQALMKLPGIGEYVAGAISSIAFEQPNPAVDGNVLRIIARITGSKDDVTKNAVRKSVWNELKELYPADKRGDFTQSLMELGATVCIPNGEPLCESCPVKMLCRAYKEGSYMLLPVKPPKKERKKENRTVFLLRCGNQIAIKKRPKTGLLASMWEFPSADGHLSREECEAWLRNEKLLSVKVQSAGKAKHIFSHVEWHMTGYDVICTEPNGSFLWVTKEEVMERYALPAAFKAYTKQL